MIKVQQTLGTLYADKNSSMSMSFRSSCSDSLFCLVETTLLLEILPVGHIFIVKLTVAKLFITGEIAGIGMTMLLSLLVQ